MNTARSLPRAVVFDLGGVLLDWDPMYFYEGYFGSRAVAQAFFDEVDLLAWNLEQDRGRSFAEGEAALIGRFPHRAEAIRAFSVHWDDMLRGPILGSVRILRELKAEGVPLYALTNFSAEKWEICYRRYDFLRDDFLDIVVSAHEKMVKPDARIYELMATRSGYAPHELFFIDDRPINVEGARAAGFLAVPFTNPDRLRQDLKQHGFLGGPFLGGPAV